MKLQMNLFFLCRRLKFWILILLFSYSCNYKRDQKPNHNGPKRATAKGYSIPKENLSPPDIIPAGKPFISMAGHPKTVITNTNVFIAGTPVKIKSGLPKICTPGKYPFLNPLITSAIDNPFLAGRPEEVIAKDAYIKDINPQNFSSFTKLQGLKHNINRCMLQDKKGNLWFGTDGGVSVYDGKSFNHFTEKEGLSSNHISSILEDKKGNFWFGTDGGGVTRYDGKYFTHFTDKKGLINNSVWTILEDKAGNIWLGTDGGISVYKENQNEAKAKSSASFINYSKEQGLSDNNVRSLMEDKNGNIWIGTYHGGVNCFDGKSFLQYTAKEGLSNNGILSMTEAQDGSLWLGTNGGGVNRFDKKSFIYFTVKDGLANNEVLSILQDKEGVFWFGTYGNGITSYDGKHFTHFDEMNGLINNVVFHITEDKNRNLWFNTGGGISRYDGKSITHLTEREGLSKNFIWSIYQDSKSDMWFSTDGGGVCRYDGKSFYQYSEKQGLCNNSVFSIIEDNEKKIWFSSYGGGVCYYDGKSFATYTKKEGLPGNVIPSIYKDKKGNIWFGTNGDGICRYDGKYFTHFGAKQGLGNSYVLAIVEDRKNNMWFGTDGGGIYCYDGISFTRFSEKEGLNSNFIRVLMEDSRGNIWIGTYGEGVCCYNGKTFTTYTEKEGLSNNFVLSILEDKEGNLWFGNRFGLSKLNKKKLDNISDNQNVLFDNYSYDDGFLGIGCNRGALFQDSKGDIWIGANDRLSVFHKNVNMADTIPPYIQINNIELFNERIPWEGLENNKDTSITIGNGVKIDNFRFDSTSRWNGLPQNLSLAYNNNYLTFDFIGITQKKSKHVKYQHKLIGLDENWSAITNNTEATYGYLPPGDYGFIVKAMNSEGYWSNELRYNFSIRSPWWKTGWFNFLVVILLLSGVYLIYHYRLKQAMKLQNVRNRIANDLHDEIGSTLSSISLFSEVVKKKSKDKLPEVYPMMNRINENINNMMEAMNDIVWTINSGNDRFENIINRMRATAAELFEAKEYELHFDYDERLNEINLGMEHRKNFYLIFKEAVNNIAKYADGKNVWIDLRLHHKNIQMKIKDDGKGFNYNTVIKSNGMLTMKKRSEDLRGILKIESVPGNGTLVELNFPIT